MNFSTLIPAIICLLLGLGIISFVLKLFASAIVGNPLGWMEKKRLQRKERLLISGDSFFREEKIEQAILTWKSAFFLDRVSYVGALIEPIHNHNISVLGRLVSISEKRSSHIPNLPLVEGLLAARSELLRSLFDVQDTLLKLRKRQKTKAPGPSGTKPDWALVEFSKKVSELKAKVDSNRQALESQLKDLSSSLKKISKQEEITYH